MTHKIRVVMMGTPDFAVPTLRELVNSPEFEVILVITQPDKPAGRKRELVPSPVKRAALSYGLPLRQPDKVSSTAFIEELAAFRPDVLVTAAYGQILSNRLLDVPPLGCLNVHASLLPRWRGAAPIHRAIMAGDNVTGVTIMKTVRALDAGPVLGTEAVCISPSDTTGTVHDQLAEAGARLLVHLLPKYASGELVPRVQDESLVTYAARILRSDEWVKFTNPMWTVHNHVRGLSPWPGTTALFDGQPLKLWQTRWPEGEGESPVQNLLPDAPEGTVSIKGDGRVWVRCADGWLELDEVQPSGKKRMSARDWMHGLRRTQVRLEPVEETE
ncbi:methionyl-tRNA formyltransferase [Alicyclobacillus mengziensis]|uniref:Methionyl-tRNA formyltransferase n=1 Tax=Alicyclobacillus mengziensis TaxID=2931921 RepID=A0A9X7Z7V6_9BACL|nr:methionyl-tRNA formyltransferase [Alicyclobacillus mengziensis]QSO49504.1 methionyl-tRNA formyltransferase [Alicyclobacillus mengziensis]